MSKGNGIPRGAPGRQMGPAGLKPLPAGTLKPGGVVYFNVCKKSTKQNSEPLIFKGNGFGIFLGVVPQFAQEPSRAHLDPLLAGIGWVSFENVVEMLGEEQFKILETKFRAKYGFEEVPEGEKVEAPPVPKAEPELMMPAKPELIGLDGRPLKDVEN